MTRFLSLLDRGRHWARPEERRRSQRGVISYESVLRVRSQAMPGVTFVLNRISFARRMELARQVREISRRAEFLAAGAKLEDQVEANLLAQEIEGIYLRWALVGIDGLSIDGQAATTDQLLEKGPEELTREILKTIKAMCGLGEEERKN